MQNIREELKADNFFANELYQYYLGVGQPRPEKIISTLEKSPFDLTEEEKIFYQNIKDSIKRNLEIRFKQTGASKDAWMAHLSTASQSMIGMLAAEMLTSTDAPTTIQDGTSGVLKQEAAVAPSPAMVTTPYNAQPPIPWLSSTTLPA